MTKIENKNFVDTDVVLDGNQYRYCAFTRCQFIYRGGQFEIFEPVGISDCTLLFRESAGRTVELLRRFELICPEFKIPFIVETTAGSQIFTTATYMASTIEARIGDVVMVGSMRGIVIGIEGSFVKILGIGTNVDTGETFVLPQRFVEDYPASQCHYLEKQTLSL